MKYDPTRPTDRQYAKTERLARKALQKAQQLLRYLRWALNSKPNPYGKTTLLVAELATDSRQSEVDDLVTDRRANVRGEEINNDRYTLRAAYFRSKFAIRDLHETRRSAEVFSRG